MALGDLFKSKELKARLEDADKQREALEKRLGESEQSRAKLSDEFERSKADLDSLKNSLANTERMTAYELECAIATLAERKSKLEGDIQLAKASYEQRFNERKEQVKNEIETWKTGMEQKLRERWSQAESKISDLEASFTAKRQGFDEKIRELNQQAQTLNLLIEAKNQDLIVLDDEILLQSYGFYTPKYDFPDSDTFKKRLDKIRDEQAALVKAKKAAKFPTNMSLNNNLKEGEKMIAEYVKLTIRAFNNECDTSINGVKFNNIESIEKKIRKAHETLNKLTDRLEIGITIEYLNLKLTELYLAHELQLKRQDEKEEQKRIREQMREEAKLAKEIEELRLKIEKEEKHFCKALDAVNDRLSQVNTDVERQSLEREKAAIEVKLAETEKNKKEVDYREQNTRAGYVYIVSNIGSFGDHVYKIGVTRRLEPEQRVDELGDASVPFDFDIHAMIFSEDAPSLENALHKAFEHRRLNLVNRRREFFHVSLDQIEKVVVSSFNKPVVFTKLALAQEFRESTNQRSQLFPQTEAPVKAEASPPSTLPSRQATAVE